MSAAQTANLAIRFAVEMFVLFVVGTWAWRAATGVARYAAAAAAVGAVATLWATVVHGASVPITVQAAGQILVFAAAIAATSALWRARAGAAFAAIALTNAALLAVLDQ